MKKLLVSGSVKDIEGIFSELIAKCGKNIKIVELIDKFNKDYNMEGDYLVLR